MRPYFRPHTDDSEIWQKVYTENEYQLPDQMAGTVLDIGGHIGSFALACCERGASVFSYEPCRFATVFYRRNLEDYRATVVPAAVDNFHGKAFLRHYPLASGNSLYLPPELGPGEQVDVIRFADIAHTGYDLVKLDCEWAEYAIIAGTPINILRKAQQYIIESHLQLRHDEIRERMNLAGFLLTSDEQGIAPELRVMKFRRVD